AARLVDLEAAEVASQRRPTKFIVKSRGADRALDHDVERAGHARVERARGLPAAFDARQTQMADRESGQTGLGLAATPGRALVTDLSARAGGGTGVGRDAGGMIVRLDLDRERRVAFGLSHVAALGIGLERSRGEALDHGGVVLVRAQGQLRRLRL